MKLISQIVGCYGSFEILWRLCTDL